MNFLDLHCLGRAGAVLHSGLVKVYLLKLWVMVVDRQNLYRFPKLTSGNTTTLTVQKRCLDLYVQAKTFITGTKGHTGYFRCSKMLSRR